MSRNMVIVDARKIDMATFGISTECEVNLIHVKVVSLKKRVGEILTMLSDKSWIDKLDAIDRRAFSARAEKTIDKIITDILSKVEDTITEEFGEYLVSDVAGSALVNVHTHTKIPLAELWKEKLTGNPGFDFHTQSFSELVAFGEAKFNSTGNPYTLALDQIAEFVDAKKDMSELSDLKYLMSRAAVQKAADGTRAFIAAFSLNAKNHELIFKRALETEAAKKLMCHAELYLIGVEV